MADKGGASKFRTPGKPNPGGRQAAPGQNTHKGKRASAPADFFQKQEVFLTKHMGHIAITSLVLTMIFSIFLFDIRFSLAGDDSAYVARAYDFIHHFIFPGFQGPLYPLVLGPFVALFGISAVPLKAFSLVCLLGFIWFFFKAFRDRIPALVLAIILALLPVNSFLLYYASQTFSEAFFMFLQSLTFWVFFSGFTGDKPEKPLRRRITDLFFLALCLAGLGLTRAIGFAGIIAVSVYFMSTRQWKNLFLGILSFTLVLALYQVIKAAVWGSPGIQLGEQLNSLVAKDYYNPALGSENLQGFIHRLVTNTGFYLSQALYSILGILPAGKAMQSYPVTALLTVLLILSALLFAFRKNRCIFFTGIYACTFLFITFLIAHTGWMQSRFIIPYFPLLLTLILGSAYYTLERMKRNSLQYLYIIVALLLFGFSLNVMASKVKDVQKITGKYYGLSPDMENYARASQWAAENLPGNALVACRKPSVSFISGRGKRFFGITRLPFEPILPFLSEWKAGKHAYCLIPMSSLSEKPLSREMYNDFSCALVGWGMEKDSHMSNILFLIMNFPDSSRNKTIAEMNSANIRSISSPDSLAAWCAGPKQGISVVYEDSLISLLMKSKVTHVLTDNLRINPERRNSQVMGTLEQFMYFLDLKYPAFRQKVIQIGDDRDEPAIIYELNYKLYGFKIPG
jgi:hypothetical protein